MEALKLLDSYCTYHDSGTTVLHKAFWSLTKARIRNTGTQTALLYSASSSGDGVGSSTRGSSCNDQTTDSILSIMNTGENLRSDHHKVTVQTRSMVLLGEGVYTEETTNNEGLKIDESKIRFKLFDPILEKKEKKQGEKNRIVKKENAPESTQNDDNDMGVLVDDVNDENNGNSRSKNLNENVYVMDPTQSTGLRQRKATQRKDNNSIVTSDSTMTSTIEKSDYKSSEDMTTDNPNDGDAAAVDDIYKTGTSNEVILLDPFDDLGMLMINCNSSHRKEIKNAQKHAIEALQYYIHAATLVASIQDTINNSTK